MGLLEIQNNDFEDTAGANIMVYALALGSFTRKQAYLMLPQKKNETVDKLLFRMQKTHYIFADPLDNDCFTSSPLIEFDDDIATALWPVLIHKGDILPDTNPGFWVGRGRYPATISYLLNGKFYDVMFLTEKTKGILIYVDREYEQEKEAGSGEHKYLFIIYNETLIKKLPKISAPHYFVLVDEDNDENPVRFIKGGENNVP